MANLVKSFEPAELPCEIPCVSTRVILGDDVRWLPRLAGDKGSELTNSQREVISDLYERIVLAFQRVKIPCRIDYELCRRFAIAHLWDLQPAFTHMTKMIDWRRKELSTFCKYEDSPLCLKNPYALNMRCVGLDKNRRPCIYTCFSQARDRHRLNDNMMYFRAVLDAAEELLLKLRKKHPDSSAPQLKCILMIDFDGFGLRDQNPRTALLCSRLISNYPEMFGRVILVDTPWVFSATWNLIKPILHASLVNTVRFTTKAEFEAGYKDELGISLSNWLLEEMEENRRNSASTLKAYWRRPKNGKHDPRGLMFYVNSDLYIKTPGDKYSSRSYFF